ncbi:hypothetical protein HK405_000609 [Cladochytrium tenue]|nr:hypothetical protein HK405_000609 [Cladochytrium tenue]
MSPRKGKGGNSPRSDHRASGLYGSVEALKAAARTADPDDLVAALLPLTRGTGRQRSARCSHYAVPAATDPEAPPLVITSFNCNEWLFNKDPPVLPTHARGLFVLRDLAKRGLSGNRVVVRGYDKFFNVGETSWTSAAALRARTCGPYELTLKENGCIIFVAAARSTLLVTSKHAMNAPILADASPDSVAAAAVAIRLAAAAAASNATNRDVPAYGRHADMGRVWLLRHLAQKGRSVQELVEFLETNNVTLVFELADDDFEEHILEYPVERRGLYLHGINVNQTAFDTWTSDRVARVADEFGFRSVECIVKDTFDEVVQFCDECKKSGSFGGRPIEGFVIRSRTVDGYIDFWKVKFDNPYLLLREPRFELTRKYVTWLKQKVLTSPELFEQYLKEQKGIIATRKLFLKEAFNLVEDDSHVDDSATVAEPGSSGSGGWWSRLIAASLETTSEFRQGIATFVDQDADFHRVGERPSPEADEPASDGTPETPDDPSVYPSRLLAPSGDGPQTGPRVVLIVPIAIVGLGKTTLGKSLARLLPAHHGAYASASFYHIQSDDSRGKANFLKRVSGALSAAATGKRASSRGDPDALRVVFADRNNHLPMHRDELTSVFRAAVPAGVNAAVLAVEWAVKKDDRRDVLGTSVERIESRGDSHQTLTPSKVPSFREVVQRFYADFAPLDRRSKNDSRFDAAVQIPLALSNEDRVRLIYDAIGVPPPPDDAIAAEVRAVLAGEEQPLPPQLPADGSQRSATPGAAPEGGTPRSAGSSSSTSAMPAAATTTPTKNRRPTYYGVRVLRTDALMAAARAAMLAAGPDAAATWRDLDARGRFAPGESLHVTLAFMPDKRHREVGHRLQGDLLAKQLARLNVSPSAAAAAAQDHDNDDPSSGAAVDAAAAPAPAQARAHAWPVRLTVLGFAYDSHILAARVRLPPELPCANAHPHVTLATFSDRDRPRMANDLFARLDGPPEDWGACRNVPLPAAAGAGGDGVPEEEAALLVDGVVEEFF